MRGGCEAVVHATRAALAREDIPPDKKWTLQIDFFNGFNWTYHSSLMAKVKEHFPELSH